MNKNNPKQTMPQNANLETSRPMRFGVTKTNITSLWKTSMAMLMLFHFIFLR